MLVLTRKQQEKIQIGAEITITILKTKGSSVRIGIEAPETVSVLRGELVAQRRGDEPVKEPAAKPTDRPASRGAQTPRQPHAERPEAWKAGGKDPGVKATLDRVPRSRVATVLPKMLGNTMLDDAVMGKTMMGDAAGGATDPAAAGRRVGGPLRSMLDRRSSAPQA